MLLKAARGSGVTVSRNSTPILSGITGVAVAVGVHVMLGVGVMDGVNVIVGVRVIVGVWVGLAVGVADGVGGTIMYAACRPKSWTMRAAKARISARPIMRQPAATRSRRSIKNGRRDDEEI
jgi:hypothetical protein